MRERLAPAVFRLPIEKIRAGYKTDVYFNRTRQILTVDKHNPRVTMQVFQKQDGATVCGVDHALAILHAGSGYYEAPEKAEKLFERYLGVEQQAYGDRRRIRSLMWAEYESVARERFEIGKALAELWVDTFADLSIQALWDGAMVANRESVMLIEGNLRDFVHLETLYLGALTDGTCVATNTRRVVEAAGDKPVIMFGARHKSHESQAGDGYAAYIGGTSAVSTMEQGEYWGSKGTGTIPHALIAAYDGDTVLATLKFDEVINGRPAGFSTRPLGSSERSSPMTRDGSLQEFDPAATRVNVVSLVDFDNDSIETSLAVARALDGRLWGVRLDTSENMIDRAIWQEIQARTRGADGNPQGVSPRLVQLVREALDREGFPEVKIVASGGFNPEKITRFQRLGVPVDMFGVGSALFAGAAGAYDYTADVVRPVAKVGRQYRANKRLEQLDTRAYSHRDDTP
ncbi:MAG: quinolinate phosphoribosyl transferase [Dehalococcoidia bacterium]